MNRFRVALLLALAVAAAMVFARRGGRKQGWRARFKREARAMGWAVTAAVAAYWVFLIAQSLMHAWEE